jgi:transmembrane sensor
MDNDHIWNLIAKKLAGEATAGDLKELESTLRLDPDLHYSLEALHDMWQKKSRHEPEQADIAFQKHLDRMHSMGVDMGSKDKGLSLDEYPYPTHRFMNWKTLAFIIAGFFLVTVVFYFFSIRNALVTPAIQKPVWEVETRNGSKTNLLLPDGSSVCLNAGSRLSYDSLYGSKIREVTLSGEAYFDVVKNPNKPFIIHAGKVNIKVLGTVFDVKSYPGEKTMETSLIRGSIEVTIPSVSNKKIILRPNQKLIIDKTETLTNPGNNQTTLIHMPMMSIQHLNRIGSDSIIAETGWMQNRLYFNDMSLRELLKNMERKYGVSFQVSDSSLYVIHFTGSFKDETVTQALDALRLTAEKSTEDFTYKLKGNQVFIDNGTKGVQSIQPK